MSQLQCLHKSWHHRRNMNISFPHTPKRVPPNTTALHRVKKPNISNPWKATLKFTSEQVPRVAYVTCVWGVQPYQTYMCDLYSLLQQEWIKNRNMFTASQPQRPTQEKGWGVARQLQEDRNINRVFISVMPTQRKLDKRETEEPRAQSIVIINRNYFQCTIQHCVTN